MGKSLSGWCDDVEPAGPYPLPSYVPFTAALMTLIQA